MSEHYDVLVIGSGAGGASLAQSLAGTGKRILILERGDHLKREARNWDSDFVFIERGYSTRELWIDKDGREFRPTTHYWVGGNTSFYGAALFRYRPGDFEETRHKGGISPAWPISYGDLAPYYAEAEKLWHVHGKRGIDPTEPADLPDYAYPPIRHDPGIARLEAYLQSLGWTPSPLPLGVMRDDVNPDANDCIRCLTCGGYPCLVRGKSDARTIALRPLAAVETVTLRANRKVTRLETTPGGRSVSRVYAEGPDGLEDYSADIVVLAAGAANTAAILLASTNPGHANGLANGSDQVGRNYMCHTMSALVSVTLASAEAPFPKTLCVNDFYWRDPEGGYDFPMGQVQMLEHMDGRVLESQLAQYGIPHLLVPDFLSAMVADRLLAFLIISEDLPDPNNRIRLDDGRIRLEYTRGDLSGHERLLSKVDYAMDRFNAGSLFEHHFQASGMLSIAGVGHMCGTTRMGRDPETSVLDSNCKAHELDNLYVADASSFVSSAAVNPTLTIIANAWRIGDHLRERLGLKSR
jgi:choline dehydrogenase-like flavoprotein